MADEYGAVLAQLTQIFERLARIETRLDRMDVIANTATEARDIAREANQSANATHRRLDEMKNNQQWLWRAIAGAIITSAIAAFIQFK